MDLDETQIESLSLAVATDYYSSFTHKERILGLIEQQRSILSSGSSGAPAAETTELLERCAGEIADRVVQMAADTLATLNLLLGMTLGELGEDRIGEWLNVAAKEGAARSEHLSERRRDGSECAAPPPLGRDGRQSDGECVAPPPGDDPPKAATESPEQPKNGGGKKKAGGERRKQSSGGRKANAKKRKAAPRTMRQTSMNRNALLLEGRRIVDEISDELTTHPVAVKSFRLAETVAAQVEQAFEPQSPRLDLIKHLVEILLLLVQNMSRYKKMIKQYSLACEASDESQDILAGIDSTATIGSILCCIAKSQEGDVEAHNSNTPVNVTESLSLLKAAVQRFKGGRRQRENCDSSAEITKDDIPELQQLVRVEQPVVNLLWECLQLYVILVGVEPHLSMHNLLFNKKDKTCLQAATNLWNAVKVGVPFDPENTSMKVFREEVVLPAMSMDSEKYNAVEVARDMSTKVTDMRKKGRKEMILPLFRSALQKTVEGRQGQCTEDYCGGTGDKQSRRRGRMTCLVFDMTVHTIIEQHLPAGTFPYGFVRTALVQSPSFIKENCNFQDYKQFFGRDEEGLPVVHDAENEIVDNITSRLVGHDVRQQTVIIDTTLIDNLRRLLDQ